MTRIEGLEMRVACGALSARGREGSRLESYSGVVRTEANC